MIHKIEYTQNGVFHSHTFNTVLGGNFTVKGSLENDEIFYKESYGQPLKVKGEDYNLLKSLVDANYFDDITFIVENCNIEVFRGVFTILNGSFCEDSCTCEFSIVKNDLYDCLKKGDRDVNFFQLPCLPITSESQGNRNLEFYFEVNTSGADPLPLGTWSTIISYSASGCFYVLKAREFQFTDCVSGLPSPPSGSGWVLAENNCNINGQSKYVMPYNLFGVPIGQPSDFQLCGGTPSVTESATDVNGVTVIGNWSKYITQLPSYTYTRNRDLDCIIEELIKEACPSITCYNSLFFNDSINYVTGQPNKLNHLLISEKSDFVNPTSGTPANKEQINFMDLYDNLRSMFDVRYFIDANNCLNIEHISTYFQNQIDLRPYEMTSKCCWEIDNDNIPIREVYSFQETNDKDFKGVPIEYNPTIANGSEEKKDASLITTDLAFIQSTLSAEQSLDGFVITSNDLTGGNYSVNNENGELTGNFLVNGHLSWANLHENYHKDWKYLPNGNLNLNDINFNSTRPIKKNAENLYKMSVSEFINFRNNISGSSVITTCGVGIVESWEYEYRTNVLKLEVILF